MTFPDHISKQLSELIEDVKEIKSLYKKDLTAIEYAEIHGYKAESVRRYLRSHPEAGYRDMKGEWRVKYDYHKKLRG